MKLAEIASENIRRIRKDRGLSQEELAEGAKYSVDTIRNIEKNRYNPPLRLIENLMGYLDVPVTELLEKQD